MEHEVQTRFNDDISDWMFYHFQYGFTNKDDNSIRDGEDITSDEFWIEENYFEKIISLCSLRMFKDAYDSGFPFQTTREERDNITRMRVGDDDNMCRSYLMRNRCWNMYFYVYYDLNKYLPILRSRVETEYIFCPK